MGTLGAKESGHYGEVGGGGDNMTPVFLGGGRVQHNYNFAKFML